MTGVDQTLAGWGNFPRQRCRLYRPSTINELRDLLRGGSDETYIPRGLGRAYGDAALNQDGGVVALLERNCFLGVDAANGVVNCEAGVSIDELINVALPRGWFPPVTPGTRFVTIGGAIAADVHGKNHHQDGTFGHYVLDFDLLTAEGDQLHCSPTENADVFHATIGGMGLTGIILRATVRLARASSAYLNVDYRRAKDLDATLEAFAETDRDYRYSVAWVDTLATGRSMGRSVLILGAGAMPEDLPARWRAAPLDFHPRGRRSVPFYFPEWSLNRLTASWFNALYYAAHRDAHRVVDYDSFFYPLDRLHHWNRVYGRRGFTQYQALFPLESSRRGLIELLERITRSGLGSFLAVLKTCGPQGPGMLSFPRAGHTLALDFPNVGEPLVRLARELDEILLRHGGRLYLAKDALTTADAFHAMYPRLEEFRRVQARLDPRGRLSSSLARRLGILEGR